MEDALADCEANPGSASAQRAFENAKAKHQRINGRLAVREARAGIAGGVTPTGEGERADAARGGSLDATAARGYDRSTQRINGEPLVYQRGAQTGIFSDMYRASQGDPAARERLDQHRRQMADTPFIRGVHHEAEERAAITQVLGEGGELIAPAYLQEQWIGVPRAGSPIADSLHEMPWIHTNSINYPKVKAPGTSVAVQTDTGSVSDTSITTELITGAAQTIAGQQEVSQQLVDLSMPGVDEVIFDDLTRAYVTQLDIKVIEGTVTNAKGINQLAGTTAITFTEATPKQGKFFSKLAKAIAEVNVGVFQTPDVIAMHPTRWAWMLAALDSQERPLIVPVGQPGFNALGLQTKVAAEAIVGNMFGIPVIVDASIPTTKGAGTNQDEVFVYRSEHLHLSKSVPVLRIFPEVLSSKLEVRYQLYGYYNAIFGRLPKAISKIEGTGLAAPTF
jgi:HK97 family phage major capsid protein